MQILRTAAAMARRSARWDRKVAFVPTMGALHDGHLSLVHEARRQVGKRGAVVVSIFVNPLQFGPNEDLSRYPRPLARDLRLCREAGVDAVFLPSPEDLTPAGQSVFVDESLLSAGLCGASRPGHFRGVCTIVLKLFNLVRPDVAVFGQKDWQQLAIIRRMVRDLNVPVRLVGAPTHREADGLAMSSRNVYLSPEERAQAPALRRALQSGAELIRKGETSTARVLAAARKVLAREAPLGRIDYLELVDADTLASTRRLPAQPLLAAAVFFGRTRLIDNLAVVAAE
ncbi:MAG: pantoate--beta-alanine ligase [Verrucomicrobia bacterium]|nr:pantoate--beta-alanine ligase [Verrucomicrobiota bacterium]